MATRPTVQETVTRWQSGTQMAQPRYTAGIQATNNWAENAVAAAPARNAGLQQAISDGRIDRGISALGTTGWRNKTLAKGPQNWLTGVQNATPQYTAGVQKLYGYLDTADNAIAGLPRGGFAENTQRMMTYIQSVHQSAQQAK